MVACWMSEQHADALKAIADARSSTTSAVLREMVTVCLNQIGALQQPRPARPNGQQAFGQEQHEVSM
jgi:hypothetical protein